MTATSQPSFDFGDEPVDDPANPTFTVSELADALNGTLRRTFSDGIWVRGEIQGWNERGGHAYFSLADDTPGRQAVLRVQFFANTRMRLRPLLAKHRLRLADGMKVRIFGQLDFYAPTGRLGLKMAGIDPRFTLGELSQARDQVVRRLVAAGMFDANRAKPLSPIPLRVGVVASVGSAAWHDFRDELDRSGYGFHLSVCDTRVQGEWAGPMVAAAIRTLTRRGELDCVVVIRGGGARNELATFDAESIALAIVTSPIPVLTGLGHEIDRSVADEVAHTALKTPTACAGALIDAVHDYQTATERTWGAIAALARQDLDRVAGALSDRAHRIARRTHVAVERADERLATRTQRVRTAPQRRLDAAAAGLTVTDERLRRLATQVVAAEQRHVDALTARLSVVDPVNLLRRGWSITRTASGEVVRSVDQLATGDAMITRLADGDVASTVSPPPNDEEPPS
jgi:exodeoxyribonuclease VII large subunit